MVSKPWMIRDKMETPHPPQDENHNMEYQRAQPTPEAKGAKAPFEKE